MRSANALPAQPPEGAGHIRGWSALEFTADVIHVSAVIYHVLNVTRTGLASAGGKSRGVPRR